MLLPNRRTVLRSGAALAAGTVALRSLQGLGQVAASAKGTTRLTLFEYGDVQLLDGPMLEQFRNNHALFVGLDDDSLLKPFRQLAGMAAPGEDMGGWYSPSTRFDPPKDMTGYIPGHSFGQYVSGLARAYAVTGDRATQAKVQRLVAGYSATISPKFWESYCLPAYTSDKTTCGLIDAHQFAGDTTALGVLDHATDTVLPFLPEKALNREEMAARPHRNAAWNVSWTWDESYTLPENFYLAYQRGAGVRYRSLAQRYLQDDTYFTALSENRNVLPGQHAYSHLNALCSAMQSYLTDGSAMHLAAAKNGFAYVKEQSFATGGWGPNESFQRPDGNGLAESLTHTHNSFETPCGAYGQFKITRYLMRVTGESQYGDSMEAMLYNTILGARAIRSDGVSFYYADYNDDGHKVDYEQKWPCCSGTFPQLTADYGISSYLKGPRGIHVNLYVPSKVTWQQGGAKVTLTQQTRYPAVGETAMTLTMSRAEKFTIALRIPEWAGVKTRVMVNGQATRTEIARGTWATVERTWKDGDRLELSLDMPLRLAELDDRHPELVALMHGPVALFAIDAKAHRMTKRQMLAAARVGESAAWEVTTETGRVKMLPYPAITTESYRLYQAT